MTTAQFRDLARRVQNAVPNRDLREMNVSDLLALGYSREESNRILSLLNEEFRLDACLRRAASMNIFPLTRISPDYPHSLRVRLGAEAPGCIWCRGDLSALSKPAVALVGSRELTAHGAAFAREAGIQAARQGYILISGNARGADQTAQSACLNAGGRVISILADDMAQHIPTGRELYICEDSFDLSFSAPRALSRNRLIHAMGTLTLVAQCNLETGGTWDGTTKNLKHGWTPVYCHKDGSPAAAALEQLGAELIAPEALADFTALPPKISLF